jgi:hypothetical protein
VREVFVPVFLLNSLPTVYGMRGTRASRRALLVFIRDGAIRGFTAVTCTEDKRCTSA